MITETTQTNSSEQGVPFGARLQSAREALGLESKEAAAQLRLNEEIILMLEKDCYSSDLPPIFIRGYLRSYGKLLQIPEHEISLAIEPIQPKSTPEPIIPQTKEMPPLTSGNYFIQMFTYLIVCTLIGLVGIWWYSHSKPSQLPVASNQLNLPVEKIDPNIALPVPVKTNAVTASVNLGAKLPDNSEATAPVAASTPQATKPTNAPAPETPVKKNIVAKAPVVEIDDIENDSNTERNNDDTD